MQKCLDLILDVDEFIKSSMHYDNGTWTMLGMEIATMPKEDKLVLDEWKISKTMEYEDLKHILSENLKLRRQANK